MTVDAEKDDLATQEMLQMMGETPEQASTEENQMSVNDTDALLSDLDQLENLDLDALEDLEDLADLSEQSDEPETTVPEVDPELDDLEAMMAETAEETPSDETLSADTELEDVEAMMAETEAAEALVSEETETAKDEEAEPDLMPELDVSDEALDAFAEEDVLSALDDETLADATEATDSDELDTELPDVDATPSEAEIESLASEMDEMNEAFNADTMDALEIEEPFDSLAEAPDTEDSLEADDLPELDEAVETELEDLMAASETEAPEESVDLDALIGTDIESDEVSEADTLLETPEDEPEDFSGDAEASLPDLDDEALATDLPEIEDVASNETDATGDEHYIQQTEDSVETMEEAIAIDHEIQEISANVTETAKEATQLALEISKKAQTSAENIQKAIEATFAATEKAFEAAKQAGYEIELSDLTPIQSVSDLQNALEAIREKNKSLKAYNSELKARIDAFSLK